MTNACTWRPSRVTLADGREVDSDSQEWLEECEAAYVLGRPLEERRQYLDGIEKKRKLAGRKQLEDRVRSLWLLRRAAK